jgi:hypothetical protein
MVTTQHIENKDLRGFKAIRIDSKEEKPCLLPVLTTERTAANKSRPQSERNPLVTFLKMTLQRKACWLEFLVGGIVGASKNRNKFSRNSRYRFFNLRPSS